MPASNQHCIGCDFLHLRIVQVHVELEEEHSQNEDLSRRHVPNQTGYEVLWGSICWDTDPWSSDFHQAVYEALHARHVAQVGCRALQGPIMKEAAA